MHIYNISKLTYKNNEVKINLKFQILIDSGELGPLILEKAKEFMLTFILNYNEHTTLFPETLKCSFIFINNEDLLNNWIVRSQLMKINRESNERENTIVA